MLDAAIVAEREKSRQQVELRWAYINTDNLVSRASIHLPFFNPGEPQNFWFIFDTNGSKVSWGL